MRFLLTLILLFVYSISFAATRDSSELRKAVNDLNHALLWRDSAALQNLLHQELTYGHSNGWIETKRDVIEDLFNGKLVYNKIDQDNVEIILEEGVASVRTTSEIDVLLQGKLVQMKLHVLQIWVRKDRGWILLSRQSTKI